MAGFIPGDLLNLSVNTIHSDLVRVTPTVAQEWLDTQKANRVLNRNAVLAYRRDMIDNRWHFTGDPIRFDVNGHLIDGQHRLTALALIEAGAFPPYVDFMVMRGLPTEAQLAMDQGRRRSTGQQLQLKGYRNSTSIAGGIRLLMLWNTDRLFTRRWDDGVNISTSSILAYAEANPELIDHATDRYSNIRDIGFRPAVGLAFTLKLGLVYRDEVTEFFSDMLTLVNQPEGSPLLAMARRLQRSRVEGLKLSEVDQLAFLIRTWNHWANGTSAERLQRPKGGEWTDANFPKVTGL